MKEMAKSATHRYRRRTASLFWTAAAVLTLGAGGLLGSVSGSSVTEPLVPLDTATLTSNMRHWTTDYAVMFYAPWCKHCKEAFMPMWQDVAMQLAEEDPRRKKKLVMAKFDCEQDTAAASFCQEVKLLYYPTFMFFGSGKFHDHDPVTGVVLGPRPTEHESSAKFPSAAMVYNEVVLNWVKAMHFVSSSNRVMAKLNFVGGDKKASSEERLVAEIEALERQNHQLQDALAGGSGGAAAGGATGLPYGYGDPYQELSEVNYDEEFDPVMTCVVDMAAQYCNIEGVKEQDPWCSTLESCIATEFVGDECWPSSCPLLEEGCQITSYCLTPELLETYVEMFRKAREAEGGVAAAGEDEQGEFWTWPEGGEGEVGQGSAAAEAAAAAENVGADEAGASGSTLPPFLGRRPAAASSHGGGVERAAGDERGETVAG